MSSLRIIGLVVGISGLFFTFKVYRGIRWRRLNFILFLAFNLSLIAVSLDPDLANIAKGMFAMQEEQRGRILALLVISNIVLWFLLLYFKSRLDEHKYQFDLLIRSLGHEEEKNILERDILNREIGIVIPAYNEAENLKEILPLIPKNINGRSVGVIVVDDGSSDTTAGVVRQASCILVRNRINRGQGAASRLGYDVLSRYNVRIGVTMDADGQHVPDDVEKLIEPILANESDLVIGSRVLGRALSATPLRDAGIIIFTKMINNLTGLKLTDCSSGFKAFDVRKMKNLKLTEEQFQSAEVIIVAAKSGLRITEVPITITRRIHGKSKKGKDWEYGLLFMKTILKSWWG